MKNTIIALLLFIVTSAFAEKKNSITIDMSGQTFGYKIKSTDFEKNPDRQIVVTIRNGKEVAEIKGRIKDGEYTREWLILFFDGTPRVVHIRKWKDFKINGECLGDALLKVETFFAEKGKMDFNSKAYEKTFADLLAFAKNQTEQVVAPDGE